MVCVPVGASPRAPLGMSGARRRRQRCSPSPTIPPMRAAAASAPTPGSPRSRRATTRPTPPSWSMPTAARSCMQANPDAPAPSGLADQDHDALPAVRAAGGRQDLARHQMPVSEEASSQAPTKLGLKPGDTPQGRGRHQGAGHQVGQRRRRGGRRSARRQRETNSPR